jgi:hypothetical protein
MEKEFVRNISAEDFYLKTPLYKRFYFEDCDEDKKALFDIFFWSGKIDWHCPKCEKEVTYKAEANYAEHPSEKNEYGSKKNLYSFNDFNEVFGLNYFKSKHFTTKYIKCLRGSDYDSHIINFWIGVLGDHITKVGQNPAMIEIEQFANRKYQKPLKEKYKEYNRAIGLFQHEIGIGSFIYLRRIFEDLVNREFKSRKEDFEGISEEEFYRKPMEDKIELVKDKLPDYLKQNQKIYGILSKGVHQLSEKECMKYFNSLRTSIDLILNQKIQQLEEEELIKSNQKELDEIKNELKE